ncbi:MAG: 2Fe-2S iron-sulfur cluster-binding protein [Pseudomonadota bacterium]|nr:2Fe-2S iron-sulfur cluster-binding protein [Pseudomonadota bacterium]
MIYVVDLQGAEHPIAAKAGRSVLELLDDTGVPIKGSCYGACNCATCHVYVDPAWADRLEPMIEQEQEALDQVSVPSPQSRLACQILYSRELAGLRLTLSEDTIPD